MRLLNSRSIYLMDGLVLHGWGHELVHLPWVHLAEDQCSLQLALHQLVLAQVPQVLSPVHPRNNVIAIMFFLERKIAKLPHQRLVQKLQD